MKALVVYDSEFGNTGKVAGAIVEGLAMHGTVEGIHAADFKRDMLDSVDLLIVGSPTHGGRPTPAIQSFMDRLSLGDRGDIGVAAFDTRIYAPDQNMGLRLLMKSIGYAAEKIAKKLVSRGGRLLAEPEGFIVEDKEGPLRDGELDRASEWAGNICSLLQPA